MRAVAMTVGRRLLLGVLVLWGAASLSFLVLHLIPGDPVDTVLGAATSASPRLRAEIVAEYGFDRPLVAQYLSFLGRLAVGDFGESYQLREPVTDVVAAQAWPTASLTLAAGALAVALALLSSTATAARTRWVSGPVSGLELVASSVPVFWTGLLLISVFSFTLGWFPVAGDRGASALVLPAITLALPFAGVLSQVLREHLESALRAPFVVSARARGVGEAGVRLRHALRHAGLPGITMTSWLFGAMFSGTVLVETVFARPGLGQVTVAAVQSKDMPTVTAIVVLTGAVFVVLNLVSDLLYPVLDPRVRTEVTR